MARSIARQLTYSFGANRRHSQPFDFHLCNFDHRSVSAKELHKMIPTMLESTNPLELHNECFNEKFPSENLLYLTPYSPNILCEYNPDDTYVIGSLVENGQNGPVTLAKAKKLGIRTAWFPFGRYLHWNTGSKSIPLNLIVSILLDFKTTQDWNIALKHVPKRKLTQTKDQKLARQNVLEDILHSNAAPTQWSDIGQNRNDKQNVLKRNPFRTKKN